MFGGGMLAPAMEDDLFGAIGTEPSEYQRMAEEKRMQRVLDAQIRKYGDDAMRVDPKMKVDSSTMPTEDVVHSYQLRMPGSKAAKAAPKDPLRSLMKQMNLTDTNNDGKLCEDKYYALAIANWPGFFSAGGVG